MDSMLAEFEEDPVAANKGTGSANDPQIQETLTARDPSGKPLVSICSSGISGVNAHVVVEAAVTTTSPANTPVLLIAGGLLVTISSKSSLKATKLYFAVKPGEPIKSFSAPILRPRVAPPIAFLFSGQGPQHINMGRQLFQRYPVFRQTVLDLDECHKQHMGKSLINDFGLFASAPDNDALPLVWPISLILPSIAVIQLALFDLLASFNLRPDLLIGHSAGETALLYAGAKEMALEIAIARGTAMTIVEKHADGTMAALSCPASVTERIIKEVSQHHLAGKIIDIACYNSPDAIALAGYTDLLEEAIALAQHERIVARRILTSVPMHSSLMDLCAAEYKSLVAPYSRATPAPTAPKPPPSRPEPAASSRNSPASTSTTTRATPCGSPPPWGSCLRARPTRSSSSSARIPCSRRTPQSSARRPPPSPPCGVRPAPGAHDAPRCVGQAFVAGCATICFNALNALPRSSAAPRPALAAYPFAKRAVEMFPEYARIMLRQMSAQRPLDHPDLRVNVATHPELAGHLINGEPIMPASGWGLQAFEFGAKTLWNVRFHSILSLSAPAPTSPSSPIRLTAANIIILTPRVCTCTPIGTSPPMLRRARRIWIWVLSCGGARSWRPRLNHFAQYGPTYRRLDELRVGGREVLVRIKGLDAELARDCNYVLHPTLLDASLHAGIHPRVHMTTDPNVFKFYLPGRVNSIFLYDALLDRAALRAERHLYAYATFQSWTPCESAFLVLSSSLRWKMEDGRLTLCAHSGTRVRYGAGGGVGAASVQAAGVPEELSRRYELLFRPFGVPAYRNQNGREANVTISWSEGGSKGDALEIACTEALRHVAAECNNKSDLRILEVQSAGVDSPLVSRALEKTFAETDESFYIVSTDPKNIAADAAPKSFSALQANDGTESLLPGLDAQTIDLVILPEDSAVGTAWHAELSHIGFVNVSTSGALVRAQAPVLPTTLPANRAGGGQAVMMVPYAVGHEMAIQAPLRSLDDTFDRPIWLVASEGYDADGLQGFGRSLRREYPQWNIRLAAFAGCYSQADHSFIVDCLLPQTGMECEFFVDDDFCIKVPRIVASPSPKNTVCSIARTHRISLHDEEVLIEVSLVSFSEAAVWVVLVQQLRSHLRSQALADSIAPLVFTILVLGDSILANPGDFEGRVISHIDEFGRIILALCKLLGLRHAALSSPYSPEDLSKLRLDADDVVLTASNPKDELLGCYVQHAQGFASLLSVRSKAPEAPPAPPPQIFSADKSYILTGGVGSVGLLRRFMDVSEWCTRPRPYVSIRTGDLEEDGEFPPRAFRLSVETVNGADPAAMVKLVGGLRKPLGGVMLLAAIWDDRLFLDQDEESFTKCFVPMVGSLKALEAAVDIALLDFVVSMSSGTTFGNQGQTNYTSANIALDGIIKKYPNAFSIATPLVHDTVIAIERVASGTGWTNWACSPGEMCNYIEDGLHKLADGPLNIYVPAVDLDRSPYAAAPPVRRLSVALPPWIVISQMQLLADISLIDLEACITAAKSTELGDGADPDPAMAAV
ncbi:acyl transferase domain-containing protein [Mycena galericulata]|nr:acyl transferase domain-containing protein [Mycena galericulata]